MRAKRERRAGYGRRGGDDPAGIAALAAAVGFALAVTACRPTVDVVAPSEPITINLNIKLDADVRVRVEEKAKSDVETKPIF